MIPEQDQQQKDNLDFLSQSYNDTILEKQDDGSLKPKYYFNSEVPWFQGHLINQPFARYALYIKRLETVASWCYDHMTPERAEGIAKGLLMIRDEHKRSVDGKSSETFRDKENNQNALLNMLFNKTVERKYRIDGMEENKRSIVDAILHKDRTKDQQND